jgi:hypothetical protein
VKGFNGTTTSSTKVSTVVWHVLDLLTELLAYDDLQVTPTGVRGYCRLADDDPCQGRNTARSRG